MKEEDDGRRGEWGGGGRRESNSQNRKENSTGNNNVKEEERKRAREKLEGFIREKEDFKNGNLRQEETEKIKRRKGKREINENIMQKEIVKEMEIEMLEEDVSEEDRDEDRDSKTKRATKQEKEGDKTKNVEDKADGFTIVERKKKRIAFERFIRIKGIFRKESNMSDKELEESKRKEKRFVGYMEKYVVTVRLKKEFGTNDRNTNMLTITKQLKQDRIRPEKMLENSFTAMDL